jgi:hypothetical protein
MKVYMKLVMIVVDFAKNKISQSDPPTIFPNRNVHKYSLTSPDGKTHNQIDKGVPLHLMFDHSGQPIRILTSIWL